MIAGALSIPFVRQPYPSIDYKQTSFYHGLLGVAVVSLTFFQVGILGSCLSPYPPP